MLQGEVSNLSDVVILGASRGIGAATARLLASQGVRRLHLVSRNEEAMQKLCREISGSKEQELLVYPCDLSVASDVDRLIHQFEDLSAFPRHWVFCVGGFPGGRFSQNTFENISWAEVEEFVDLNLKIPLRLTHRILPELLRDKSQASLIYLSSQSGFYARPGSTPYATTKFALNGFAKSLFEELRESLVKVSLIAPGFVDTELIPDSPHRDREKMICVEDVASSVSWALTLSKSVCPLEIHLYTQQRVQV